MWRMMTAASCLAAALAATAEPGEPKRIEPTFKDVAYGPHERHMLNLWKAESEGPTPVLISIHGGGWRRGAKSETMTMDPFLKQGISVVSISYRLCPPDQVPAPLLDAARALQFVRHKAEAWGLDPARVAVMGHSAGGCTALWLALHDDLADPKNDDPVRRESTKPVCALSNVGQTFIDARMVRDLVGEMTLGHSMIWQTVGAPSAKDAIENYDSFAELYREYSPLNHLDQDDPPILLYYKSGGDNIHSSRFGDAMVTRARELGAPVYMYAPDNNTPPPAPDEGRWEFLYRHLLDGR